MKRHRYDETRLYTKQIRNYSQENRNNSPRGKRGRSMERYEDITKYASTILSSDPNTLLQQLTAVACASQFLNYFKGGPDDRRSRDRFYTRNTGRSKDRSQDPRYYRSGNHHNETGLRQDGYYDDYDGHQNYQEGYSNNRHKERITNRRGDQSPQTKRSYNDYTRKIETEEHIIPTKRFYPSVRQPIRQSNFKDDSCREVILKRHSSSLGNRDQKYGFDKSNYDDQYRRKSKKKSKHKRRKSSSRESRKVDGNHHNKLSQYQKGPRTPSTPIKLPQQDFNDKEDKVYKSLPNAYVVNDYSRSPGEIHSDSSNYSNNSCNSVIFDLMYS